MALAVALLAACSGDGGGTAPTTSDPPPPTIELPPELAGAGALGIGDGLFPTLGNPGFDVQHYRLDLRFEPAESTLTGLVTIDAVATAELDIVNLDFTRLPTAVRMDGGAVVFGTVDDDLVIAAPDPIEQGTPFTIEVEYEITPGTGPTPALAGREIGWFTRGDQHFVLAEPDGARSWYPANDHPLDKATYTFVIDVPEGLAAAANGSLVESTTAGGRTRWTWASDAPMASYLATVVVGPFDVVEDPAASAETGVSIRHVLPRGTGVADWPGLERTGQMLAFLAERFGPFPFDTYGVALVDARMGVALETQTLSVIDSGVASSSPQLFDEFLIHELAHQWYGNSVSLQQWSDVWLTEGFATYAVWLWQEAAGGLDLAGRTTDLHGFWSGADPHPIGSPQVAELFAGPTYEVGALTLHSLRLTMGDDGFFELLKAYADRFEGSTASSGEFMALASEIAEQDLAPFFDSWLGDSQLPPLPAS